MSWMSQRAYARHREKLGLRGRTLRAVQRALATGRIGARDDGKIESREADGAWLRNTSTMRAPIQESTATARRRVVAEAEPGVMIADDTLILTAGEVEARCLQRVADFANAMRRPENLQAVAEWMLDRGRGPEAAWHAAQVWDCCLAIWMSTYIAESLGQEDVDVIEMHPAPDWPKILGCDPSDIERWRAEARERDEKLYGADEEVKAMPAEPAGGS